MLLTVVLGSIYTTQDGLSERETMKIRLDHVLIDLEGEKLIERRKTKEKDESGKPVIKEIELTLGKIGANALMTPVEKDTGDEKAAKGSLAMKIYSAGEIDLSIDELKLLKDNIDRCYGPLVITQARELLEGK